MGCGEGATVSEHVGPPNRESSQATRRERAPRARLGARPQSMACARARRPLLRSPSITTGPRLQGSGLWEGGGRARRSTDGGKGRGCASKQASTARGGGGTGMDMLARAGRPCALLRAPRGRHWPDTSRYHCFGWVCGGGGPWVDGAGLRTRSNRTTTHCTASSSSTTTGIDRRRAPCSHPAPHPAHLPTQPAHTTRTGTQDQGP